jgi:hypothetical protein
MKMILIAATLFAETFGASLFAPRVAAGGYADADLKQRKGETI